MRPSLVLAGLTLLGACGGDPDQPAEPDGGAPLEPASGGTLALAGCGYSVTTRSGASAPVMVPAGSTSAGPGPTPRQVHLGLATDPSRSMVIVWRTEDDATRATTVRFGKAAAGERSADGFSFWYQAGTARPRVHEVHLCDLEPDTVYRYQVGGGDAWSPERAFRTAPAGGDASAKVTALVLGDSRGGQDVLAAELGRAAEAGTPDLVIFTGDAVSDGSRQGEWDRYFTGAEPLLATVPALFAHGNHEANAAAYYAQVALPGNESWYALDYGPLHLAVLNDTPEDAATVAGAQRDFLDGDLAAHAGAPWKLLVHHKSMYSSSAMHGSDLEVRAAWGPVVDQHHVELVLSGHDHDYERSRPMRGQAVVSPSTGTVYVVTGGAGAPLYGSGTGPSTAFSASTQNFLMIEARAGMLAGKAYRADGSLLDTFSMTKP